MYVLRRKNKFLKDRGRDVFMNYLDSALEKFV